MASNQGRDISQVVDDLALADMYEADRALWLEARDHPPGASCSCPGLEYLAVLYAAGYRLKKEGQ